MRQGMKEFDGHVRCVTTNQEISQLSGSIFYPNTNQSPKKIPQPYCKMNYLRSIFFVLNLSSPSLKTSHPEYQNLVKEDADDVLTVKLCSFVLNLNIRINEIRC